jgi:hypothetical protein
MRYTFSLDEDGLTGLIEKSSRSQFSDPWRKMAASWSEAESRVEGRDGLGFLVGVDGRVGLDWSGLDLTGDGSGDGTAEKKSSSSPWSNWFINKASSSGVGAMVRLGVGLQLAKLIQVICLCWRDVYTRAWRHNCCTNSVDGDFA